MLQATFSGKTAVLAQQKRLDIIANNMANVSTPGYKARTVSFKDALYNNMVNPTGNTQNNLRRGTGVIVSAMDHNFSQGIPMQTGVSTDFSIDGEGFFSVLNTQTGETLYTRNGAFALSVEPQGRYLITKEGYYVLDAQGERIVVPEGDLSTLSVSANGMLAMGTDDSFAQIGLVTFPNIYGLATVGNNTYEVTDASGNAIAVPEGTTLRNGYLENSNEDMVTSMVAMIRAQRAFQFASRALTTADEMDATANNMRR